MDHNGEILEESGPLRRLNTAAFMIHSAVHVARPDVLCAAHTHSIHGRTFSTLGRELDITTQDSCAFYNVSGVCCWMDGWSSSVLFDLTVCVCVLGPCGV